MGKPVEMAALGHALDHLFGIVLRQHLIAGEVLRQRSQALGAEGQQRLACGPNWSNAGFASTPHGSCRCTG